MKIKVKNKVKFKNNIATITTKTPKDVILLEALSGNNIEHTIYKKIEATYEIKDGKLYREIKEDGKIVEEYETIYEIKDGDEIIVSDDEYVVAVEKVKIGQGTKDIVVGIKKIDKFIYIANTEEIQKEIEKEIEREIEEITEKAKEIEKEIEEKIQKANEAIDRVNKSVKNKPGTYVKDKLMDAIDIREEITYIIGPLKTALIKAYDKDEIYRNIYKKFEPKIKETIIKAIKGMHKAMKKVKNLKVIPLKGGTVYIPKNKKAVVIKVPERYKGLVIGKGGYNLKRIEEIYGVKIIVS